MHWPDRIGGFLKPADAKEVWEAVARSLVRHHPKKLIAILKTQPHREAWTGAESLLELDAPGSDLLREIKAGIPAKAASPGKQEMPDPFAEGR